MTRRLKPQEVDSMRFPDKGLTVPLMLDRNELDFFAQLTPGHDVLRAKSVDELKKLVRAAAEKYQPYTWRREIWIDLIAARPDTGSWRHDDPPDPDWPAVGFKFKRLEVSPVPGTDRHLTRPWWEEGEEEPEVSGRDYYRGDCPADYVLPYSPETWEALTAVQGRILLARRQLLELLSKPDLEKTLRSLGASAAKLLPGKAGET